jgi:hypothetical protein
VDTDRMTCVFCRSDRRANRLDSDHVIYVYYRSISVSRLYNSGRSTQTSKQGDSHGKFVVEEVEVGLWRLNVLSEDFIYV